jgi:hypothetical protein
VTSRVPTEDEDFRSTDWRSKLGQWLAISANLPHASTRQNAGLYAPHHLSLPCIDSLVEEAKYLASDVFSPGLLVIHDALVTVSEHANHTTWIITKFEHSPAEVVKTTYPN